MSKLRAFVYLLITSITIAMGSLVSTNLSSATDVCDTDQSLCGLESMLATPSVLSAIATPSVSTPEWMKTLTTFTYSVSTRGVITADLDEFKQQAYATLNDSRGWSRLDAQFKEVENGGDFTLVLAEASQVPNFAPTVCSSLWSCAVGSYVIINQDRWLGATTAWNNAGGSLRDYRHMVVNHEVGHWLGHGHQQCGGTGQLAPIMQQQSIDLGGCTFNPWPLDSELWSSRL